MVRKLKLVEVEQDYCDVCGEEHEAEFIGFPVEVAGTKAPQDLCGHHKAAYVELVRAVTGILIGDDGELVGESGDPAPATPKLDKLIAADSVFHQAPVQAVDSATPPPSDVDLLNQPAANKPEGAPATGRRERLNWQDDPDALMCPLCTNKFRNASKYAHADKSHGLRAREIDWIRVADLVDTKPAQAADPAPAGDAVEIVPPIKLTLVREKKAKKKTEADLAKVRCPVKSCREEINFKDRAFHAFKVHKVTGTDLGWIWVNRPERVHICVKCTGEFPSVNSLEKHAQYYQSHPKETHKQGGVAPVAERNKYAKASGDDVVAAQGNLPAYDSTMSPF